MDPNPLLVHGKKKKLETCTHLHSRVHTMHIILIIWTSDISTFLFFPFFCIVSWHVFHEKPADFPWPTGRCYTSRSCDLWGIRHLELPRIRRAIFSRGINNHKGYDVGYDMTDMMCIYVCLYICMSIYMYNIYIIIYIILYYIILSYIILDIYILYYTILDIYILYYIILYICITYITNYTWKCDSPSVWNSHGFFSTAMEKF